MEREGQSEIEPSDMRLILQSIILINLQKKESVCYVRKSVSQIPLLDDLQDESSNRTTNDENQEEMEG